MGTCADCGNRDITFNCAKKGPLCYRCKWECRCRFCRRMVCDLEVVYGCKAQYTLCYDCCNPALPPELIKIIISYSKLTLDEILIMIRAPINLRF